MLVIAQRELRTFSLLDPLLFRQWTRTTNVAEYSVFGPHKQPNSESPTTAADLSGSDEFVFVENRFHFPTRHERTHNDGQAK